MTSNLQIFIIIKITSFIHFKKRWIAYNKLNLICIFNIFFDI